MVTHARLLLLTLLLVPGSARAQAIDAALRSDIERLMDATGASKLGTQIFSQSSSQLFDQMKRLQPQIPERVLVVVKEVIDSEFSKAFADPAMRTRQVELYAKHFTHDDVRSLLGFYDSEVGRKLVSTLPVLTQESFELGQQWVAANMPRIIGLLQTKLKEEGLVK
jgi:hypothetical protein